MGIVKLRVFPRLSEASASPYCCQEEALTVAGFLLRTCCQIVLLLGCMVSKMRIFFKDPVILFRFFGSDPTSRLILLCCFIPQDCFRCLCACLFP